MRTSVSVSTGGKGLPPRAQPPAEVTKHRSIPIRVTSCLSGQSRAQTPLLRSLSGQAYFILCSYCASAPRRRPIALVPHIPRTALVRTSASSAIALLVGLHVHYSHDSRGPALGNQPGGTPSISTYPATKGSEAEVRTPRSGDEVCLPRTMCSVLADTEIATGHEEQADSHLISPCTCSPSWQALQKSAKFPECWRRTFESGRVLVNRGEKFALHVQGWVKAFWPEFLRNSWRVGKVANVWETQRESSRLVGDPILISSAGV